MSYTDIVNYAPFISGQKKRSPEHVMVGGKNEDDSPALSVEDC